MSGRPSPPEISPGCARARTSSVLAMLTKVTWFARMYAAGDPSCRRPRASVPVTVTLLPTRMASTTPRDVSAHAEQLNQTVLLVGPTGMAKRVKRAPLWTPRCTSLRTGPVTTMTCDIFGKGGDWRSERLAGGRKGWENFVGRTVVCCARCPARTFYGRRGLFLAAGEVIRSRRVAAGSIWSLFPANGERFSGG